MENEIRSSPENRIRISDVVIPVGGLAKYVARNIRAETTGVNGFANGFYHLLLMHIMEVSYMATIYFQFRD